MLTFTSGNMFDTPADIRINTVNCVGVMGAGLALAFKTKYPDMFRDYQKACKEGKVRPGQLHVWNKLFGDCIINFPTKRHWREPSRYEDIEAGLIALRKYLADKGKVKVLLPAVGCGHGGLEWNRISEMIKKQLADVESEIIVFTPEDSRAAGDKIKDHEDAQIQDRLDAENIKIIEPGHDLYPESFRGRTAAKIYVKGNPEKLNAPLLTIMPSPKPTQQEIDAAATVIATIMRPGITLLIGYGATIERPAIKKALEKGADVVVILSEGILEFRVRKDLLDVWDENLIVVISATKPIERWSPSTAFRAKDLQLSLASAAIITDTEPQSLSKMLIQKASQKQPFIYYVDYGKRDTNIINTFKTIKAQSISVNDLSDPKQYEAIISTLGANELTQPISERNTESISAPIAEYHETNECETRSIKEPEVPATGGTGYPKRLIEVDLPIGFISRNAAAEMEKRRGHIPMLHIWWAHRPPVACRAILLSSLLPDPADINCSKDFIYKAKSILRSYFNKFPNPKNKLVTLEDVKDGLLSFIRDVSIYEYRLDTTLINLSNELVIAANPTTPLTFIDPFAGGGIIPFESIRLNIDTVASDLNPCAVLINKVVLEYIPKYKNKLATEVEKWGIKFHNRLENSLSAFYPSVIAGEQPVTYLWSRTIVCEGPKCGVEIPLLKQLWISRKGKTKVAFKINQSKHNQKIDVDIVVNPNKNEVGEGTVKKMSVTCPCCGYTTPVKAVREQIKLNHGGTHNARLLAVVYTMANVTGRYYRKPLSEDFDAIKAAKKYLKEHCQELNIPLEKLPNTGRHRAVGSQLPLYGFETWADIFTERQLIALSILSKMIAGSYNEICESVGNEELGKAIVLNLALLLDKMADMNTSLCVWQTHAEIPAHLFGRKALPMITDFAEAVPISRSSGTLISGLNRSMRILNEYASLSMKPATILLSDATKLPMSDSSISVCFTDPPYYDSVPYSDLSDFFYVWLKRCVGSIYPDLFQNDLTSKECEATVNHPNNIKEKNRYIQLLTKSWLELRRIIAPDGIAIIVFAHKSTDGWEALLESIIRAGWFVTASWPIDTEMQSRMNAKSTASLASSVHLVCRPLLNKNETGDWRDVITELPKRIHEWMPRLAEEGVVGADAIFACLGPALEIFSRYSSVEKASGEKVTLKEYLEQVWAVVAKEALNVIFEGADTSGFEEDARLTAMWLWTLSTGAANGGDAASESEEEDENEEKSPKAKLTGYTLEYDAARKIAQGLGAHLEHLQSLIEVKGDKARLLPVSERTKTLFGKDESEAPAARRKKKSSQLELGFMEEVVKAEQEGSWGQKNVPQLGNTRLDRLHQSMILFAAGRGEALKRFLVEEGVGHDQKFWRLAQALSALYPSISDEKRWVDGVLARKKGFGF